MATSHPPPAEPRSSYPASIDELDEAIRRFARQMNVASYRLLVLVREFDERLGWAKWSFSSCAEWLHWRIGIGNSDVDFASGRDVQWSRLPAWRRAGIC